MGFTGFYWVLLGVSVSLMAVACHVTTNQRRHRCPFVAASQRKQNDAVIDFLDSFSFFNGFCLFLSLSLVPAPFSFVILFGRVVVGVFFVSFFCLLFFGVFSGDRGRWAAPCNGPANCWPSLPDRRMSTPTVA